MLRGCSGLSYFGVKQSILNKQVQYSSFFVLDQIQYETKLNATAGLKKSAEDVCFNDACVKTVKQPRYR